MLLLKPGVDAARAGPARPRGRATAFTKAGRSHLPGALGCGKGQAPCLQASRLAAPPSRCMGGHLYEDAAASCRRAQGHSRMGMLPRPRAGSSKGGMAQRRSRAWRRLATGDWGSAPRPATSLKVLDATLRRGPSYWLHSAAALCRRLLLQAARLHVAPLACHRRRWFLTPAGGSRADREQESRF